MNEKGRTSLASGAESFKSKYGSDRDSKGSNLDSQMTQKISRKSKKNSDLRIQLFEEIRQHYRATRTKMGERLKFEQLKTTIRERLLRNISVKFKRVWRLVQNKTLMFSLVRNAIRTKRTFGMSPVVLSTMVRDTDSPSARRVRLLRATCDRLFQLHLFVLLCCICYLVVFFPLNIAFDDVHSSAYEAEVAVLVYLCFDIVTRIVTIFKEVSINHQRLGLGVRQYLQSYFILELLGSFPAEYLFTKQGRIWHIIFFLPRLFRSINSIINFQVYGRQFMASFKKLHSSFKVLAVMLILLSTFILVNISSCCLIVLADISPEQNWYLRYRKFTRD